MAFKLHRPTITLDFEDETGDFAGLEVEVKSLPMGEFLTIAALVDQDNMTAANVQELLERFATVLVSWNIEDENDRPLPANLAGLLSLPISFNMKLITTWTRTVAIPAAGGELGKGSAGGAQFPGAPLTMEAL